MDEISTLLVAFMFITILTLGIAGVLAELAEDLRQSGTRDKDGLLLGWTLLLLFMYFDLFWHTADIALLEEWDFGLFLFAELGPVLLLFTTQIALGAAADQDAHEEAQTLLNRSRFFGIFALVHVWTMLVGFVLGTGFTVGSALSAAMAIVCILLSTTNGRSIHWFGLGAVALLALSTAALTNFG